MTYLQIDLTNLRLEMDPSLNCVYNNRTLEGWVAYAEAMETELNFFKPLVHRYFTEILPTIKEFLFN